MPIDNVKVWDECLSYLSQRIRKQSFYTWLRPTKGLPSNDNTIRVAVPNRFVAEWLEEHYISLIQEALHKVTPDDLRLTFCVRGELSSHQTEITFDQQKRSSETDSAETSGSENRLSPRYIFETFVVGESNHFAHAAAMAVAEAPGKTKFNPLTIYGGVGLGKTHLAQAVGHFVREEHKDAKVLYATSERFTNDFIRSIRANTTQEFVDYYRNIDVLLLDDIQFFTGKESTQVQFFHTFNALYHSGKQIVLTSDRPPKDINGLEERLLSRFQWGLVTDIQPPDLETRIAILKKKTESDGIAIPNDVANFIANNVTSNIRELEGSLIRLLAYSSLTGKELTIKLAEVVLKDILKSKSRVITIREIQRKVAQKYKIAEDILCSKRKTQEVALARQVAMYLCRHLTNNSLKAIGESFGGRDHSTVIHACGLIAENLKKDYDFKIKVDEVINSLYG